MLNKKATSKNMFKKGISTVLASIMALGSGASIATLNKTSAADASNNAVLSYFNDTDVTEQTRIMMDGSNFLNRNYWMKATIAADTANAGKYTAKLEFTIPGYEQSNLKFYVRDRSSATSGDFVEYNYAGGLNYLYLTKLNPSSYEVHVYNGSLAEENFVCKADFSCILTSEIPENDLRTAALVNGAGAPATAPSSTTALNLMYGKSTSAGSNQLVLELPSSLAPFDASTIKVAFFAKDSDRNDVNLNIDHILYDYTNTITLPTPQSTSLVFVVDPQWGTDASYEAHFYKDSVAPNNFICKAVDITVLPN